MFEAWPMFFISIAISMIASSSGIGGAIFFSPIFLIVYKFRPELAFTLSLFIEVFGFGSGLFAYFKEKLIDFFLAGRILIFTIPGLLISIWILQYIPEGLLQFGFSLLLFFVGVLMLFEFKKHRTNKKECHLRCVKWKKGTICYHEPKDPTTMYALSTIGGMLVGFFSSGLGEIDEYIYLTKLKMHAALAAGTSLLVVAVTALVGSLLKLELLSQSPELFNQAMPIAIFSIPGVILGGQIGVKISEKVRNPALMRKLVGTLILFIALLLLFAQPL